MGCGDLVRGSAEQDTEAAPSPERKEESPPPPGDIRAAQAAQIQTRGNTGAEDFLSTCQLKVDESKGERCRESADTKRTGRTEPAESEKPAKDGLVSESTENGRTIRTFKDRSDGLTKENESSLGTGRTFVGRPDGKTFEYIYKGPDGNGGLRKVESIKGDRRYTYTDGRVELESEQRKKDKDGADAKPAAQPKPEEKAEPTKATDKDGNEVTTFTNDKENRIKETRFYDRKHGDALSETEYKGREDKLAKKTDFLNRTEKTFENGNKLTEYNAGDRRNPEPNLKSIFETANGNYKNSEYSGRFDKVKSVREYKNRPDGLEKYTTSEDGTSEARYKDGTIKQYSKDGDTKVIKPKVEPKDESTKATDKDGNEVTTFKNDKDNRVKETRFYDRKHGEALSQTEYQGREDNLAKKTEFLNRTEKTYENGNKLTEYNAGDRRNPEPNLKSVFETANGNYKNSEYSGRFDKVKSIREYKNRQDGLERYTSSEDGTSEARYKDGTIKKYDKDGEATIIKPKAEEPKVEATKHTDKDGNEVTTFTNDKDKRVKETRFYDHKHGDALSETEFKGRDDQLQKKTDYLNRTESTYEDGSRAVQYNAGDRRNPDPHVSKVFESGSGNYKRTEFTGRFDKVKFISEYKNHRDGLVSYTGKEDGSGEYQYKDGTVRSHDKDGNVTEVKKPKR